ncbi:hypothetical protein KEM56_003041 [Ascosphaera pollenicola]|nr:hypothetical protein KEM56_003041 [Ascosphaera pollenicola]
MGPRIPGSAPSASYSSSSRKPLRFIIVDSTTDFKPDYWNRVVAVFTTGQTWQFKSYKWSSPPELFKHATGIYVGWTGEEIPAQVKAWGRGVRSFTIDRWDEKLAQQANQTNNPLAGLASFFMRL